MPDGRDLGCPLFIVPQGAEPPLFTCHFATAGGSQWDPVQAVDAAFDPYTRKLQELAGVQEAPFYRERWPRSSKATCLLRPTAMPVPLDRSATDCLAQ